MPAAFLKCLLPSLILMIFETAIGETYAAFGTYMAYIWIKYSPLSVWYDLGTVLARFRGGATISKQSTFQIFLNFGRGGGAIKNQFFPNSKKSKLSWGGGAWKLWTFSTIYGIFCSEPKEYLMNNEIIWKILQYLKSVSMFITRRLTNWTYLSLKSFNQNTLITKCFSLFPLS